MSVISISGLTLGYLTLPAVSAAGLEGSCLTRNAELSGLTLPSATTLASSVRSSSEVNVGTLRRYGSPPAVGAVESALAIFSEITRIRPAWARSPEVAMLIERAKSPPSLAMMFSSCLYPASALADRGFEKMQALAVERGHRRVVHLVGGNLEHLVLEIDRIAGGPGLEACLAIQREALSDTGRSNMAGRGAHHRQRSHRSGAGGCRIEFRLDQIARLEIRRVGIGDVLGEQALTLLMPLHLGPQRRQHGKIVDGHRCRPSRLPARCPEVGRICRVYG